MNILVIGSGAREHAIAWKLAQSPRVNKIYTAPGNAGTASIAENLPIEASDIQGLVQAAINYNADLTVVGPEAPLAAGIVDHFVIRGMQIFGPVRAAAQIESSKAFSKDFMQRHKIPAAFSKTFSDYNEACSYVELQRFPLVIKADGLSQGKGVMICANLNEAKNTLKYIMQDKAFGDAGNSIIVEEMLAGRELSAFSFADAHYASSIATACDYKRIYDGGFGPNTGGMGSYSPPEFYTPQMGQQIYDTIVKPVIKELHDEHRPYKGMLYSGLMLTDDGPKVLEFNARFGDPETQVILPRLNSDLLEIMLSVSNNRLQQLEIDWALEACVGVVMASGGYPGKYQTGYPISGLEEVDNDIMVFHSGTSMDDEGNVLTSGGRVLTVAATGATLGDAREKVYDNIKKIHFKDCYYRKDIALI